MTFLWVLFWMFVVCHLLCCCVGANDWKLRGYVLGLILFLQITQFAKGDEHSILVRPEFSITATSYKDTLTIVANSCDDIKFVEITTNPPATNHRYHPKTRTYVCDTSEIRGRFQCVVCTDHNCTPIDIAFTADVVSVLTPTLADADTPNGRSYWPYIIPIAVLSVLAVFLWCERPWVRHAEWDGY